MGLVQDEVKLVIDRLNGLEATRAILLQQAVSAIFSEDAGKHFTQTIKRLNNGE